MSGRKPAREGGSGAAHPPPPPPGARQQCSLKTLTLDGSLFDAPATGRPVGGSPRRPAQQAGPLTGSGGKPRAKPHPPAGAVLLDNGEGEGAFINTLRSHFTRNGTAESFAPKFSKSPTKTYSPNGRSGVAASGAAAGRAPGGLAQQERALWEEREEELVDAQERRFAQLEDALAARESKREAYLVHRLEATAARKIEEHRRIQEAAARARELAVQRVQQLPSLQKARAAAQPASPTAAAFQKLAKGPPCAASPGLAAVQQAVAGVSSLGALSTLHAGLESGLGAGAAGAGAPLLGAGRHSWEDKRQAAAAKAVDAVYDQIQASIAAAKAAGAPLPSPLDAAKDATRLAPVGGSRRGSSRGTHPSSGLPAGEAATVPHHGSEAEEAVNLPHSRAASSLGSGANLTAAEPGDGEEADGPAGASLDPGCEADQPRATTLQPGTRPAEVLAMPAFGSEEGGTEEAAQLDEAGGGGGSGSGGRPVSAEEPDEQPLVAAVTGEVRLKSSAGQPASISHPSAPEPEEASTGGHGGSRCAAGAEDVEEGSWAAPAVPGKEPVTAAMLAAEAEVAAAAAADVPAAVVEAEAEAAAGVVVAAEEPVHAMTLAAEVAAAGADVLATEAPSSPAAVETAAAAQMGAEEEAGQQLGAGLLAPGGDAGPMPGTEQSTEPVDHSAEGMPIRSSAAATGVPAAEAETALLEEPSAQGAGAEPATPEPQPALEEPEAAEAAAPPVVACQQCDVMAGAAAEPAGRTGEQAAGSLDAAGELPVAGTDEQAAPASAAEDFGEGGAPAEAPPAGGGEQQAATAAIEAGASEQPSAPSMEAAPADPAATAAAEGAQPPKEQPAAAAEGEADRLQLAGLEAEAATAPLLEEQQSGPCTTAGVEEPATSEDAAEGQVAAAADALAAELSCGGPQAGRGSGCPADRAEVVVVEAGPVLQGEANEQRATGMAAADSAEALGLTQRASASLLFGGRSADGADPDGGTEEGTAQRADACGSEAGTQAAEAGSLGDMDPPAVPSGSASGEGSSVAGNIICRRLRLTCARRRQDQASPSRALHKPAAPCLRKRAARRQRGVARSFDQLPLSGDTAATACPKSLTPRQRQAGAGNRSGDVAAAQQEPLGLQPDTPPKPAGTPHLLLSHQPTRVLLSPHSRGTLRSDAASAHAAGNGLGGSNQPGGLPSPNAVAAAAVPLAASLPKPAAALSAVMHEVQLAHSIEVQLAQQVLQEQLAQQLAQQQAQELVLEMEAQLAWEAQAAWLAQSGVQHALQAQQAQQAAWGVAPMQLTSATQALPDLWLVRGSGPSVSQQTAALPPVAMCLPVSPHNAYSPHFALALPALLPPGFFPQPGGELLQGYGPPSLTPHSSLEPFAASPLGYGGAAGSSPFADARPSLFSAGDGQPGTPWAMQPAASPRQQSADAPERPMRPPPRTELEWLLSKLPHPSPIATSSMQPADGMAATWREAANLVQALPPSQAQPLLHPVEPLPPPPPLPNARMLQPPPAPLPAAHVLLPRAAGSPRYAVLDRAGSLELAVELPLKLEGQLSEQLLLPFLDSELLDVNDELLLDLIDL